jgi:hypothetical protein
MLVFAWLSNDMSMQDWLDALDELTEDALDADCI